MQVVVVGNIAKGIERAKEEIYTHVDRKTVLFLSGGKTPKPLYETIVKENILKLAAAALIDERYGEPMHKNSNERMIAQTGILDYFSSKEVPFYNILQPGKNKQEAAHAYDEIVRKLFFQFPKSVGILGMGADGHTAGIAPNRNDFTNPIFDISKKHIFAASFDDTHGSFGQRVTLTFSGLSLLDFIIVLAFGKDKKEAVQKALVHGSLEEIPARFYQNQEISKKTVFITDQKV